MAGELPILLRLKSINSIKITVFHFISWLIKGDYENALESKIADVYFGHSANMD